MVRCERLRLQISSHPYCLVSTLHASFLFLVSFFNRLIKKISLGLDSNHWPPVLIRDTLDHRTTVSCPSFKLLFKRHINVKSKCHVFSTYEPIWALRLILILKLLTYFIYFLLNFCISGDERTLPSLDFFFNLCCFPICFKKGWLIVH